MSSSGASWPRSYFDVASENDVSDEIHVEATSADLSDAVDIAGPDCQGHRPSTQASGRVIRVDKSVRWTWWTSAGLCMEQYLRVEKSNLAISEFPASGCGCF